jgi:hypothetical protein
MKGVAKPMWQAGVSVLVCLVYISGVLGQEVGVDRPGQDLKPGFDLASDNPQLCKTACDADPNCRAYTYVKPNTIQGPNPRCWLKSGVPAAVRNDCCISGVKGGARAAPVVINFEELPTGGYGGDGNPITVFHQYDNKGIIFNDPLAFDYSKGVTPWKFQGFTHSGMKAIEQCYHKDFCSTPIEMNFTNAQNRVKVWVGYSDNLAKPKTVTLTTLNSTGAQIGQVTATLQPSSAPIPIQTPLEFKSDITNIVKAIVSSAPIAGQYPTVDNIHLAVDDVEFDTAGPPPFCASTQNPTVTLAQPTSGQVVTSNAFDLKGTITTTAPLEKATLITTGSSGSHSLDLLSGRVISHDGGPFSSYGIMICYFQASIRLP